RPCRFYTPIRERFPGFARRLIGLSLFLDLENLPAAIFAGFKVDMMRPAQLAGLLVLDIRGRGKRVVRTAIAPLPARGVLVRYGHFSNPNCRATRAMMSRPYRG